MSLDCPERYVNHHRPDIADAEEYPHEERRTDDESKEKDAAEMEYDPDSSPHADNPEKILQESFFFGYFRGHYLRHVSILAKFFAEVKDL